MNNKSSEFKKLIPLWIGQFISLIGSAVVQFSLIWYVTTKTESVIILSLCTLMNYIPIIFFSSVIGNIVDKINKKKIIIFSDLFSAIGTCIFLFLIYLKIESVIFILLLFFLKSICQQFQIIGLFTAVSKTVSEDNLSSTSGINQTINGISNFVAPILGALVIKYWQINQILLLDIGSACLGIIAVLFFKFKETGLCNQDENRTLKQQIKILKENMEVFKITLIACLLNMVLIPTMTLLPILINNELHKDSSFLAVIETVFAVGMIVSGIMMGIITVKDNFKKIIKINLFLFGLVFLLSAIILLLQLPVNLLCITVFLLGVFVTIVNTEINAIIQIQIDKDKQGLISGSMNAICTAIIPLGLLIATLFSNYLNVKYWFLIAGIMIILINFIFFTFIDKK